MDSNGDGNGNEDRIGDGGREAKKRTKSQNSCRRRAGNGGDTGRKRKKYSKERVGLVAANPDNLESNKETGGGAQGAQGSSKKNIHTYIHTYINTWYILLNIIEPPIFCVSRMSSCPLHTISGCGKREAQ